MSTTALPAAAVYVPVPRRASGFRRWTEREDVFSWLMIIPPVLFLLLLIGYPLIYGVWLSLESRPVAKAEMAAFLSKTAPRQIGGQNIVEISERDGIKYIMADDSWLLIRPSGTEPVLRVYVEGRTQEMVRDLMGFGQMIAERMV